MMGSKHYKAATDTASTLAARLDQDVSAHDPESFGLRSLLLRGAIAAAQHENRRGAYELLTEADEAAARWARPTCAGRRSALLTPACTG